MSGNELTGQIVSLKDQKLTLEATLEKFAPRFEELLPSMIPPERFMRMAVLQAIKNPALFKCTPESFVGAALECAAHHLVPGVAGQCWLIPYKGKATFVAGYRGLIQLARRSHALSNIEARVVWQGDEFEHTAFPPHMAHTPLENSDGSPVDPEVRGSRRGAYAAVRFKGTDHWQFEWMPAPAVVRIRDMSPGSDRATSPWIMHTDAMWQKTTIMRIFKFMPHSIEDVGLQRVMDVDELGQLGKDQDLEVVIPPDGEVVVTPTQDPDQPMTACPECDGEGRGTTKAGGCPVCGGVAGGR